MSKLLNAFKLLFEEGPSGVIRVTKYYMDKEKKKNFFVKQSQPFHLITKEERKKQQEHKFKSNIKFSILTPLYNTDKKYLEELFHSLENQTYKNWELCLADGSDEEHQNVKAVCEKWMKRDKRIKYTKLLENKGISENTNACIDLATGDYFGLLDHDDVLHESALFEMAKAIEEENADFLYSDEAKFSGAIDEVTDFTFKSGFGKDELRSHNYICHFTVFSKELLKTLGICFRHEFDGSQDHDLVLRLTENAKKIKHISKILYYWRVHPGSVSMDLDTKSYAVDAAVRAVEEQLIRQKEYGTVRCNLPYRTIYRTEYKIDKLKKVSILLHHLNKNDDFERLKSEIISVTDYPEVEVICIDGFEKGFAEACNFAIKESTGKYIVLLNAKCRPKENNWLKEMLMYAQRNDVCAVGNKVLYQNATVCHAGISLDNTREEKVRFLCEGHADSDQGYEAMMRHVRNTTAVWDGCCMFKKSTFEELGGFRNNISGYELIDFCLRGIEAGYWNVWSCFSEMIFESNRERLDTYPNGKNEFCHIWQKKIESEDTYCHHVLRDLNLI